MSSDSPISKAASAAESQHVLPDHLHRNLQQLDRLANLGLFSASIAHEIKNGMVAVNTFCEVMMDKGENREMAEVVRRELKRIDGLATQMLRFAAPKPATLAPMSVHGLLDLSLRLLEHQIKSRMITLRRDYRATPDMVRGDESHLQQAFMNLLFNAVEAMGHGGDLTASTETIAGAVKISVRDTGAGITPQNLAHIFETFFTTKKNGTGLGLAITHRIIQEHSGCIEVQSELGRGSTFVITLPGA